MPNSPRAARPNPTTLRCIELRGVRVHNLKNLDLDIPLGKFVVISGVSGSGKGSLAFDTLYSEGQRRYVESFSIAARQHLEKFDRPDADRIAHVPPAIAVCTDGRKRGRIDERSTVAIVADVLDGFRMLFTRIGEIICPDCQIAVKANQAADIVALVDGLPAGTRCQLVIELPPRADPSELAAWLARGFSRVIWDGKTHDPGEQTERSKRADVLIVVDRVVAGKTSTERLLESTETALREGGGKCILLVDTIEPANDVRVIDGRNWKSLRFDRRLVCSHCAREFLPLEPRLFSHRASGACLTCQGTGHDESMKPCPACNGSRFRDETVAVKILGLSIVDMLRLKPDEASRTLQDLNQRLSEDQLGQTEIIRNDLLQRLQAVSDLGFDYLTLDRAGSTLSGGETRRLMLAAIIGSRITGTLVVVDEPSAGLSISEIPKLIQALRRIQSRRNSVIVVDHSPALVAAADFVVELGPGAGPAGGMIVYQGKPRDHFPAGSGLLANSLQVGKGKTATNAIRLRHVLYRNLVGFDVDFPLGKLTLVTGPSGSGKTTLVEGVLFPAVCRVLKMPCEVPELGQCEIEGTKKLVEVVLVDQSPLTKSARSNPATWLDVFNEIRHTFSATVEAKQRGFTAQHFGFNSVASGRCRACLGTGLLKQDMQFLPDVTLMCPECHGTRFRREILEVKYRGRSIADVLAMSVSEAAVFFRSQPRVQRQFQFLKQIGLDYVVLGQPSETLSGGEAQRLKLAARLAAPTNGACLIICDEPTTGLHPTDVLRLIESFRELIANGNTLVLADNSPELVAAADHVVKLGE